MVRTISQKLRSFAAAATVIGATLCSALSLASTDYVGTATCAGCHEQPFTDWQGSHHDLAMQAVTEKTVLGNFDDATFTYAGTTSTFYRKDDAFWVRTDNAAGELEDFRVAWVFGVFPLQQYLLPIGDGKLQALTIA